MSKVAVIYWSGTGNTQAMAAAVADGAKESGAAVDLLNSGEVNDISAYDADCRMFFGTLLARDNAYLEHSRSGAETLAIMNEFAVYAAELAGVRGTVDISSASCHIRQRVGIVSCSHEGGITWTICLRTAIDRSAIHLAL